MLCFQWLSADFSKLLQQHMHQGVHTIHNWLVMSEKLKILNPQRPLCECWKSPVAANSAFCCYSPCYWEFRLLLSKPCGWLLIKTLEAAYSLTDRNVIQGQSRNTLSDLTYTIKISKPLNYCFYTYFWISHRDTGEFYSASFQYCSAVHHRTSYSACFWLWDEYWIWSLPIGVYQHY